MTVCDPRVLKVIRFQTKDRRYLWKWTTPQPWPAPRWLRTSTYQMVPVALDKRKSKNRQNCKEFHKKRRSQIGRVGRWEKTNKIPQFPSNTRYQTAVSFPRYHAQARLRGRRSDWASLKFYLFIKRWITLISVPWSWFIDIFSVLLIIEMSHCIRRFSTLLIAMTNWGVPSNQDSDNFPILM